ncbi:MAG TPA: hypothetical protein VJ441_00870 [Dehalococcoidia bacterium]|nr:hypothetical protein [Dehalococcoidia bacterium]
MADKAEMKKWIQTIVEKLNDVGRYTAADWGGSVQLIIRDLGTGWLLKFAMDGTVESCDEKIDEEAATSVLEFDSSDTFIGIQEKTVDGMEAFSLGKVKARKSMDGLVKVFAPLV